VVLALLLYAVVYTVVYTIVYTIAYAVAYTVVVSVPLLSLVGKSIVRNALYFLLKVVAILGVSGVL
jgi:hypothetical protein